MLSSKFEKLSEEKVSRSIKDILVYAKDFTVTEDVMFEKKFKDGDGEWEIEVVIRRNNINVEILLNGGYEDSSNFNIKNVYSFFNFINIYDEETN